MKSFLTRVTVGEFSAEGEGNSKKLSKKRAALSILQDLKKLPFIPAVEKPKTHYKKRTKTILKVPPISRASGVMSPREFPTYSQSLHHPPFSKPSALTQLLVSLNTAVTIGTGRQRFASFKTKKDDLEFPALQ